MAKSKPSASSSAQKRLASERAAAARQRIQVAQRRRQLLTVAGAVGVVIVIVAVLIVVKVVGGGSDKKSGDKTTAATAAITAQVAGVPATVFNQVGAGDSSSIAPPKKTDGGAALTGGGLPRVLYVGAEFCPYCAAERWPLAVALSRFGTFTGLGETTSSPSDVYPSTHTLSFYKATYASKYLDFTGKELESNQVVNGNYSTLDTITGSDEALFTKNGSSFPYVNVGGKWTITNAQYDPNTLKGLTQAQIAKDLSDSTSKVAQAVIASANRITADLCTLTNGSPAAVCSSSGVTAAETANGSNGG